ncbi:uncharacterized protein LOC114661710 [Erpetoichthys calabaricus]|uniref:uncharacterized protein LOC114661710 n=1 Tax=Erpetoichthys calabaricus TaxID=27687 RepID=UPI00109FC2E2|nr:uncharacterized protein LOC114661710 [Erpetoichthys calabaricus]
MVTTLDLIKQTLDRLKKEDLKQFRLKLSDATLGDGTTIPAGIVETCKNTGSLAEKLINHFTAAKALSVVAATLRRCDQNELALQLEKKIDDEAGKKKSTKKKAKKGKVKGKIMTIKKLLKEPDGNNMTPLKVKVLSVSRTINYINQKKINMQMKFLELADKTGTITGKLYDMTKTNVIKEGQCVCLENYKYVTTDKKHQHVIFINSLTKVAKIRQFHTAEVVKTKPLKNEKGIEKEKSKMTQQKIKQSKQDQKMPGGSQGADHHSDLLNILNNGSKKQIKSLKNIGEKRAQQIVDWRNNNTFMQIEDLEKIDGISSNVVAALKVN